jgi:hypothetical protein
MFNNEEPIFSNYPFEESADYWKQRYYEMAAQRNKLQNEFNALFVENGKLTKLCYYYRHCLRSQKRIRRKMHIYKVEMERLRRKLTRIYKAIYRAAYIRYRLQSYLPFDSEQLEVEAIECAKNAVAHYKCM